jgi:hypothetical protein
MLVVQLNDIREKSMEVRVRAGVHSSRDAVALKAEVREHVITWLQREYPAALPRNGVEFEPAAPPSSGNGAGPGDKRIQ